MGVQQRRHPKWKVGGQEYVRLCSGGYDECLRARVTEEPEYYDLPHWTQRTDDTARMGIDGEVTARANK